MAKILISAYACEPNKGSEPEVGWQWVINIAKRHEVWVLTKENNSDTVEPFFNSYPEKRNNIHMVYVPISKKLTFWKKGNRGMRLYYYLWAKEAYEIAKKLHNEIKFDLVHSITFVSVTQPCFLYKLGIPFIWTIAGGENISPLIHYPYKFRDKLYELIRSLGQRRVKKSRRTLAALKKAELLLATTQETVDILPEWCWDKTIIRSAIGIEKCNEIKAYTSSSPIKVLLSGKFNYLKGMDIGVRAILKIANQYPDVQFDILASGRDESEIVNLCAQNSSDNIQFIRKVEHSEMLDFLREHDILLNTALRDSGCLVVMEAMSVGLPVVCIDTGGVKEMTTEDTAIKIAPQEYNQMVCALSDGMEKLIKDAALREKMGKNGYDRINQTYLYGIKCDELMTYYETIINS